MNRWALVVALLAFLLAGYSLGISLNPPPNRFQLVCSETFTSNGASYPVWYPCSTTRPH